MCSDIETLSLSRVINPAAQSPNMPWTQEAQGFQCVKYPLQCATFSCYLLLILAGACFVQEGFLLPSGVCQPCHS